LRRLAGFGIIPPLHFSGQAVPEPTPLKYRAFISYSHADTTWAKWLQRGLEAFKIDKDLVGRDTARGAIPETLRPIFRDREDFTAGEALPAQTLAALDASNALIVVCSPDSARSAYVNEEARLFKSRHPKRPVIPLIVGGKPGDPKQECFPPAIKFKVDTKGRVGKRAAEPLAADARDEADGKDLALAKVIAGLLGLSSDDVFRRAERERRTTARRRRRVQAAIAALVLLLVVGGLGWLNQAYLQEQYYWQFGMRPTVLTRAEERERQPKDPVQDCDSGCPDLVVIPAGKFTVGALEVSIANPFAAGKHEVSFSEWQICAESGACPASEWEEYSELPVINVSWEEAKSYVAWLSRITGKSYRLLSEAEWEYISRSELPSALPTQVNATAGNPGLGKKTSARLVGLGTANGYGLYDMAGNVSEWVEDCFSSREASGAPADGSARAGTCGYRVVRGGSNSEGDATGVANRKAAPAKLKHGSIGFRVARDLAR
jgi:formylglycine-generating enzyme required for sulfatase activity